VFRPFRALLVWVAIVACVPGLAWAAGGDDGGAAKDGAASKGGDSKAFRGSGLFYGRSVKPPVGARRFAVGLDVAVAPMDIAYRIAGDRLRDEAIDRVCEGSADPACRTTAAGYVDTAMDALAGIPDSR
jgi:hypothetical protein